MSQYHYMSKDYKEWQSKQLLPGGKVRKPTLCACCGQVYHGKNCHTCGYTPVPPPPPQYGAKHVNWHATDNVNMVLEKMAAELDRVYHIIEEQNARIAEIEGRYTGTCAECHKPAMADDYLCREHREAI